MPGPYYFAWVDAGEPFDPGVHNTYDQQILSAEVSHAEGEAAVLEIRIVNPGVGALTIGRWCWFSFDGGTGGLQPVFNGRLIGSPADLQAETITLQFRALPEDYIEQKAAVAASLRVLPHWDPVWFVEKIDDPDTVLEPRNAVWHVDRLTLLVSASNGLDGEDGTLDVNTHLYQSLKVSFGATPLRRMVVTGKVAWKQKASGEVDLTTNLWQAFRFAGSPFAWPQIGSFTSDGLAGEWPKPGDQIGGGWSISANAVLDMANFAQGWIYPKTWVDMSESSYTQIRLGHQPPIYHIPGLNISGPSQAKPAPQTDYGWKTWKANFTVNPVLQHFVLHYDADRDRSELVTFELQADIQPQAIDIDSDDEERLDLESDQVDKEIEADGSLPIGNPGHNAYFATDRGNLSLQCLALLAAAKMMHRARSVTIQFELAGWPPLALGLSCRKSVLLHDRRLPGGQALGKITAYKLTTAGGRMSASVTIGCAVGYGVVLPPPEAGEDVYATGYSTGYTQRAGAQVAVLPGVLQYDSIAGTVIDDDGVDFANMNPETVLLGPIVIENGSNAQQAAIDVEAAKVGVKPDPIEALRNVPTRVNLKDQVKPVTGGAFYTEYPVVFDKLVIAKMIDLEAA